MTASQSLANPNRTLFSINPAVGLPRDQEVFFATPWQIGNTGRTQKHDYNRDFEMRYRIVDTSRRLVRKNGRVKNTPEKQISEVTPKS